MGFNLKMLKENPLCAKLSGLKRHKVKRMNNYADFKR